MDLMQCLSAEEGKREEMMDGGAEGGRQEAANLLEHLRQLRSPG
jgi:hypothetical protein